MINRNLQLLTLLVMATLAGLSRHVAAEDWPTWRGPNRDGISTETGWKAEFPKEGPKIAWKKNIGTGSSSMAVSQERLYTMGHPADKDVIYCLEAASGQDLWRHEYPCQLYNDQHEGGPASTPQVDGDRVYALSRDADLFCLDIKAGNIIWSKQLEKEFGVRPSHFGFTGSPLILDDMLVVDAGIVFAFEKKSGRLIWKTPNYGATYSSPTVLKINHQQFPVSFSAFCLALLDIKSGREVCKYPWPTPNDVNAITPVTDGDKVFIASGYGVGCALLQMKKGRLNPVWQNKNLRSQFSSPILFEGHLYGFDQDQLRCLDFKTGDVRWFQSGLGRGLMMLTDRKLIISSEGAELVICEANPEKYRQISSASLIPGPCRTVPVLSNGKIYIRNAKGDLVCIDVSGE